MEHKMFVINDFLFFLEGYGFEEGNDEKKIYSPHLSSDALIISNAPIKDDKKFIITELYRGPASDLTDAIADTVLVANDSSANPSRPFKWYKFAGYDCADTNNPDDIKRVRDIAKKNLFAKIDDAEFIYITKLEMI